jgi:hypothetical protein
MSARPPETDSQTEIRKASDGYDVSAFALAAPPFLPPRLWCALSEGVALSSTSPVAILATMMAAPITLPGRFSPRGPLGISTSPTRYAPL